MGALEGLGRLSSLEGEAFPRAVGQDLSVKRTKGRLGHSGLNFRTAVHRLQVSSVPTGCLLWHGSMFRSADALLCYGCRARLRSSLLCSSLYRHVPTGSGSAVVRNYLVWDAIRRETAILSATHRLPVREYGTQSFTLGATEAT